MKIAVIGSGIAGMGAAYLLSRKHEVVLFEKEARLGGHTHTHTILQDGQEYQIDTGFIVFNPDNYPLLSRLFAELGIASQATTMGFSVQNAASGLEYNATNLDAMFCQRRNVFSPKFIRMARDILRFYKECQSLLSLPDDGPSLGDYLKDNQYSTLFIDDHIVPMACALWSSPSDTIAQFPAKYLVQFMHHHRMLQVNERPQWRVVQGGSSSYIHALEKHWKVDVRLNAGVQTVARTKDKVNVTHANGDEIFDHIVFACHSDQALALLSDANILERDILGRMAYQNNETVLHTDASILPKNRKAWAAWNAYIPASKSDACTVSYCMNILQSVQSKEPFVVTLNRTADIAADKIIAKMQYQHPVFTQASVKAKTRRQEINGKNNTWFAGAYWGFGFHEDGLRSGVEVARALGIDW